MTLISNGRARSTAQPGARSASRSRRARSALPAGPRGLAPGQLTAGAPPSDVVALAGAIAADGGSVLATYREPIGGSWIILAGLPLDRVHPTPFQRDLSEAHVERLGEVIDKVDRYLDPIIAVRRPDGTYWTPNGNHRRGALERLGAQTIIALVLTEERIAYRILALNTEKAHNVREKALEVVRMARALAQGDPLAPAAVGGPARSERDFWLEFEDPSLLTLGLCYEQRPRFSGSAYQPILRRVDGFLDDPLPRALDVRAARARSLLAVDDAVVKIVATLKERGFESPYLKTLVVGLLNPLRALKGPPPPFEATFSRMLAMAERFDPADVRPDHVARASGPPEE